MALSTDKARSFTHDTTSIKRLPVAASTTIYQGAAVAPDAGGDLVAFTDTATFSGFAMEHGDNSAGADGDIEIDVATSGELHDESVTGVTGNGDVGSTVYMTDDDTFTLTAGDNTAIGKVSRYISGTRVDILFEADPQQSI